MMMKTTPYIVLAALLFLSTWLLAQPALNITSCIDNTIYEESTALSNGLGDYMIVGRTPTSQGGNIRRGLIQTDFCLIPSNATIISVELNIQVQSGYGAVSLHRALKPWGEGTSNAPGDETSGAIATAGDATWSFSSYNTASWDNAGGDFTPTASAISLAEAGKTAIFSTSTMRDDVQSWVNGAPNHGWLLRGAESSTGTIIRLKSGDILSGIPYITVQFTVPPRKIVISEVNTDNQWVEIFNPGLMPIDMSDWYLCNNDCDLMTSTAVNVATGSVNIPAGGYTRLEWSGITPGIGQIALMKSKANYFEVMEDYVQYGSGNQSRSQSAVNAGVWDFRSLAAPTPTVGNSIGLMEGLYFSGADSYSSYWERQSPTPGFRNTCTPFRSLTGTIPLGNYAAERIEMNGVAMTGSGVSLYYSEMVEFKTNAEIPMNSTFQVIRTDCAN